MRKSRILVAVLAATMFVLAAFGFVACDKDAGDLVGTGGGGDGGDRSYTVTFNYGQGSGTIKEAQTVNGKVTLPTPTPPANHTNKGWFTAATGGTQVTNSTTFNKNTTIYAQYTANGTNPTGVYTITFNYNGGSGTPASADTTGGKLSNLPNPTTAPAGKKFDAWYTSAVGGTKVTTSTAFDRATTIYAQYTNIQQGGGESVFADAVAIDTTADDIGYMVDVNAPDKGVAMTFEAGDYGDQYVLENYHIDKDVVIKFQNGTSSVERTTISGGTASGCFEAAAGGIKVVKAGTFTFYVKIGEDEIYVNGSPDFENVDGDTMTVTVNCKDGTITFVIEKDGDKTPHLHGWTSGGDLFTGWPGKALSDGDTVDLSTYNMGDLGLIVNYGEDNAQTQDIKNLSGGNITITVSKTGGHKIG